MNVYNPAAAGGITTQTDVTASRAIDNTVYHNTTAKPIFCVVTVNLSTTAQIAVSSDATATPTLVVGYIQNSNALGEIAQISFWVLPGNYYKAIKTNTATLTTWIEYT